MPIKTKTYTKIMLLTKSVQEKKCIVSIEISCLFLMVKKQLQLNLNFNFRPVKLKLILAYSDARGALLVCTL